jgi:hypothetical protein
MILDEQFHATVAIGSQLQFIAQVVESPVKPTNLVTVYGYQYIVGFQSATRGRGPRNDTKNADSGLPILDVHT